jgi:hypothetical protein
MKPKENMDIVTLKLHEFESAKIEATENWEYVLQAKLGYVEKRPKNNISNFKIVLVLLVMMNLSVILFAINKKTETNFSNKQHMKTLVDELLIPTNI